MDIDFKKFKNVVKVKRAIARHRSYSIFIPRDWFEDMGKKNLLIGYNPITKIMTLEPTDLPVTMKPRGFKRLEI